jgi:TRAP transporter TAXI family solute receptor
VSALTKKKAYYRKALIPVKSYPGVENKEDVPTFGVKASFLTSSAVSNDIVYAVTKEVFENLKVFKTLHPAFAGLTKEEMVKGIPAPIHPGAMKYYKETGLDKHID